MSSRSVGYSVEAVATQLIRAGQWREAVFLYREESGASLTEAEDAIEDLALRQGVHRYSRPFLVGMIASMGIFVFFISILIEWMR